MERIMTEREQEVFRVAHELYNQAPDWVTFFREVLGVTGIIRQSFKSPEELAVFEQSEQYEEIQHMLAKLRERSGDLNGSKEPTRVITVRLPQSLHESLRAEAHERRTSMNKLCISKLLQIVDRELVPAEA
jgi:predicted HicB family RNase H-like nuclease